MRTCYEKKILGVPMSISRCLTAMGNYANLSVLLGDFVFTWPSFYHPKKLPMNLLIWWLLLVLLGFMMIPASFFGRFVKWCYPQKPWVSIIKCSNLGCFGNLPPFQDTCVNFLTIHGFSGWWSQATPLKNLRESCWGSSCNDSTLGNPKE